MPSVDNRLRHVDLKLKRAKEHVFDLGHEIRSFLDTNPYKVETKRNPQTRQLLYYLTRVEPTPDGLPLLAGDAVQNLMSALDHMAYQIVCSDTRDNPPKPARIYFPIAESYSEYEAIKHRKMEGALEDSVKDIDVLKPYKGGNDLLWALHRLNNIEKHRLLFTVGSSYRSLNLGALASAGLQRAIDADPKAFPGISKIPIIDAFFRPASPQFPLKVGDVLFTDAPDAEFDQNLQFRFDVALDESEVIEAQSLLETLHQLTALVEGIVSALKPRLK